MPPQPTSPQDQKTGLAIVFSGGLLMTFDAPILRLVHTDIWTMVLVRGLFMFMALFSFWLMLKSARRTKTPFVNGYLSVLLSCIIAVANITFLNAIFLTSVANVVFLLALNPLFAAVFSWIFLGEKTPWQTWVAIFAALVGVVIIVWGSIGTGHLIGDLLALFMSILLAASLTLIRHSGTNQSTSPAFGHLLAAVAVIGFASPATLAPVDWGWLALNGLFVLPVSIGLLLLGPRYLPAAVVAMFFLLETVLTPIWMWLIFGEIPTIGGMIGGAIIVAVLFIHGVWTIRASRARSYAGQRPELAIPEAQLHS